MRSSGANPDTGVPFFGTHQVYTDAGATYGPSSPSADGETLCIRTGLRWTIRIPRAHIVAIHKKAPKSEPFLRAALPMMKPLWIELTEPVTAQGPYGIQKQARWISVAVDDAKAFQGALSSGTAGTPAGS